MIDGYRICHSLWSSMQPRRRTRRSGPDWGIRAEALEERYLLSAVMTHDTEAPVVAECETLAAQSEFRQAKDHARSVARKKEFPDVSGSWTYTLYPGGDPIVGELELTQKGKKVKGTLTREFQEPGAFKGKLKSQPAENARGTKDVPDLVWFLLGNVDDVSVDSLKSNFAFQLIFLVNPGNPSIRMEGKVKGPEGEITTVISQDPP